MKSSKLACATLALMGLLAGCGPGDLSVVIEVDMVNPETGASETQLIEGIPVHALPYDRDAIFDSLAAAAPSPEPVMPESLVIGRDSANAAREVWQAAEDVYLEARTRLLASSAEIERTPPTDVLYNALFVRFNGLQRETAAVQAVRDAARARMDTFQAAVYAEQQEYDRALQAWEAEAFADWAAVVEERLNDTNRDALVDTTDAAGMAHFTTKPAQYWVHARVPVADDELYWNEPTTVERGALSEVRLGRANAEVR